MKFTTLTILIICVLTAIFSAAAEGKPVFVDPGTRFHLGDNSFSRSLDPEMVGTYPVVGRAWERKFELSEDADVEIEIRRLWGLNLGEDSESAVYLDGVFIGPLRREHNKQGWSSGRSFRLTQGMIHVLRIESGGEEDADDFVFEGVCLNSDKDLRLIGTAEILDRAQPVSPAAAPTAAASPVLSPTATPTPVPPCGGLIENTQWPSRFGKGGIILSITASTKKEKRQARSGILAMLKPGQFYELQFKINPRQDLGPLKHPPLQFKLVKGCPSCPDSRAFVFAIDWTEIEAAKEKMRRENFEWEPRGYKRGLWNTLRFEYCPDNMLYVVFDEGNVEMNIPGMNGAIPLEIWAEEVELVLRRKVKIDE